MCGSMDISNCEYLFLSFVVEEVGTVEEQYVQLVIIFVHVWFACVFNSIFNGEV
jgi:hypothetical protein